MSRRLFVLPAALVLALPLLLAGACSWWSADVEVGVEGEFGSRPELSFPDQAPGEDLAIETITEGDGRPAAKGDLVIADYVGYRWSEDGNKLLASSYSAGKPAAFPIGRLLPGLTKALDGARPGSRVVARIPPEEGYGDKGAARHQVGAGDTLVYVLDVRAVHARTAAAKGRPQPLDDPRLPKVAAAEPGRAPTITVPETAAPKELQVRTLIQGGGEEVGKGQLLALQYVGVFWRDGKPFDASWPVEIPGNRQQNEPRPSAVTIGTGQVMEGWDRALVGQQVGSRLLLVVPPSLGYGKKGLPQAGIKGSDTLVFVVDILGAH